VGLTGEGGSFRAKPATSKLLIDVNELVAALPEVLAAREGKVRQLFQLFDDGAGNAPCVATTF
jgi:hypothetical protein